MSLQEFEKKYKKTYTDLNQLFNQVIDKIDNNFLRYIVNYKDNQEV